MRDIKIVDAKYFLGNKIWFIMPQLPRPIIVQDYIKSIVLRKNEASGVWEPEYVFARGNGTYHFSIVSDDYDDLVQLVEAGKYDPTTCRATIKEVFRDVIL